MDERTRSIIQQMHNDIKSKQNLEQYFEHSIDAPWAQPIIVNSTEKSKTFVLTEDQKTFFREALNLGEDANLVFETPEDRFNFFKDELNYDIVEVGGVSYPINLPNPGRGRLGHWGPNFAVDAILYCKDVPAIICHFRKQDDVKVDGQYPIAMFGGMLELDSQFKAALKELLEEGLITPQDVLGDDVEVFLKDATIFKENYLTNNKLDIDAVMPLLKGDNANMEEVIKQILKDGNPLTTPIRNLTNDVKDYYRKETAKRIMKEVFPLQIMEKDERNTLNSFMVSCGVLFDNISGEVYNNIQKNAKRIKSKEAAGLCAISIKDIIDTKDGKVTNLFKRQNKNNMENSFRYIKKDCRIIK